MGPVPCTHSSRDRAGSSSTALPRSSPTVLVGVRLGERDQRAAAESAFPSVI